jgi:hypothetical protein
MTWSVVTTNLRPVTVREGAIGWRRGPQVPTKPGNAGGGKGPQFKADVESGEVLEIGATLANSVKAREPRQASHAEVKEGLGPWSGKPMSAQVVASAVVPARP